MSNLRIGLPSKGRLEEICSELLSQAGLNFRRRDRTLFAKVRDLAVELIFLRADDIPVLCAEGAIDLGMTGSDLVEESEVEVTQLMPLGVGKCQLALCVPIDSDIQSVSELDGKRVATSFPKVTRKFLAHHGALARTVNLSGSVEIMVQLGVADAVVDLVETGSTLAANRLRVFESLGSYQTVLIQSPKSEHHTMIERVKRRLEGVIIARAWSLLEYNIPREKLHAAEEISPGFKSPTINPLEDPDWCAVRVMVRSEDVHPIMEKLEALGATAILETEINNCRL